MRYPVSEVLRTEAYQLHMAEYARIDWSKVTGLVVPDGTQYRAAVEETLAPLDQPEVDIRLLALLDVAAGPSGDVMIPLTTSSASAVHDLFIDALERRGLTAQARAMRKARAAYAVWAGTPATRRKQWTDGAGAITNPVLLGALKAQSRAFLAAQPTVMDRAVALVASDAQLAARYEAMREAAEDAARLGYLMREIWACTDTDWWTPEQADAALNALPRPQRDLLVLDLFIAESMNGSTHQFFFNSSGVLAPELAEILDRHGLSDHAEGIRQEMAIFSAPYPRDTEQRRKVMVGFHEATDNALYDLTVWADDGAIWDLMSQIAKDAGLWPT